MIRYVVRRFLGRWVAPVLGCDYCCAVWDCPVCGPLENRRRVR